MRIKDNNFLVRTANAAAQKHVLKGSDKTLSSAGIQYNFQDSFNDNMKNSNYQNIPNGKLEDEIKEIFGKICQAFGASDIDLALSFFADNSNMIKISNGHVLRGKKQLSEYWYQHIGTNNGLRISIDNIEIHKIDDKHVWSIAEEYISLGEQNYKAIVSNVFVLTSSGWKILLDHTTSIKPE